MTPGHSAAELSAAEISAAGVGSGRGPRTLQLGMSWFPEQAGNGLDRVYFSLVHHLPAAGVEVCGLVAGSPDVARTSGRLVRAFCADDAPLLERLRASRRAVREALASCRPDLVATHFALYTVPALDLLRGRPLVTHFHGPWADESRVEGGRALAVHAKAAIERAVYGRGHLFIVLSHAFAQVLRDRYGVDERRVRVVPGGVDTGRLDARVSKAQARERLGWPADRPIVLSVRRLYRRMGLENLVDAFRTVRRTVPDASLYIAGKGPIAGELQARIEAAGLTDHVRLLGFVPEHDLPLAYRAADLSVVPTVALEGFGLVTVESLAAGTPVLVSPNGGLPEVVRDLAPDLILPDLEPATIADRLGAVLRGELDIPDEEACRSYARSRFDWGVIARRTRRVYEEALLG